MVIDIKQIFKNIILSFIYIYGVNLFVVNLGYIVPINFMSVLIITFLGVPGLIVYSLLAIKYM